MPRWVAISNGKNAAKPTNTSLAPSPRPNQAVSSGAGEQRHLAQCRQAGAEQPLGSLAKPQQQAEGQAGAAAQQQAGQGTLQAQAQRFGQRAVQHAGLQAAQYLQR